MSPPWILPLSVQVRRIWSVRRASPQAPGPTDSFIMRWNRLRWTGSIRQKTRTASSARWKRSSCTTSGPAREAGSRLLGISRSSATRAGSSFRRRFSASRPARRASASAWRTASAALGAHTPSLPAAAAPPGPGDRAPRSDGSHPARDRRSRPPRLTAGAQGFCTSGCAARQRLRRPRAVVGEVEAAGVRRLPRASARDGARGCSAARSASASRPHARLPRGAARSLDPRSRPRPGGARRHRRGCRYGRPARAWRGR